MSEPTTERRLKLLCCEVLYREACLLASETPAVCDLEFLPKGLHDLGPQRMLARLQERVDAADGGGYEAVLLGYGLCNNGIAGLAARRTRMVAPRAHDCITLFLGGSARYREYFDAHPGTYYRTTGWYERESAAGANEDTVSQKLGLFMRFEELVQRYGEDNARYIMETMGDATINYDTLAFIKMGLACEEVFRQRAAKEAAEKGWAHVELEGSMSLLRRLINGPWDDDFLVLQPGQSIAPSYDEKVVKAVDAR